MAKNCPKMAIFGYIGHKRVLDAPNGWNEVEQGWNKWGDIWAGGLGPFFHSEIAISGLRGGSKWPQSAINVVFQSHLVSEALRCILRRPDLHQPVCLMIFPSLSDFCVKSGVHTRRGSVRKCCIIRKRGGRATKEMSHYPKWPAASFRPLWLCSCPTSREARQKEGKGEIWWKIFMDAWFTSTSTQGFGAWEIA